MSHSSTRWPRTHSFTQAESWTHVSPPSSAFQGLELQAWATTPGTPWLLIFGFVYVCICFGGLQSGFARLHCLCVTEPESLLLPSPVCFVKAEVWNSIFFSRMLCLFCFWDRISCILGCPQMPSPLSSTSQVLRLYRPAPAHRVLCSTGDQTWASYVIGKTLPTELPP